MHRGAFIGVASVVFLTACGGTEPHIYRKEALADGGTIIATDAKQRIILDINSSDAGASKRRICAEPSPDVTQAIADAVRLSASVDLSRSMTAEATSSSRQNGMVDFQRSVVASVAQLGERLATIQLLRDKMYRACEAYANDAVGATGYTLMLARIDKTMVSLLSSELAAGAYGRALASLGGEATVSGVDSKYLEEQKAEIQKSNDALKTAISQNESSAIQAKAKELNLALAQYLLLERAEYTGARSIPGTTSQIGTMPGRTGGIASSVASIHQAFIDDDGLEPLVDACITAMDNARNLAYRNQSAAKGMRRDEEFKELTNKIRGAQLENRPQTNPSESKDQSKDYVNWHNQILLSFLTAGDAFSAFCYRAVFADDAPYVASRLWAKRELRKINYGDVDRLDKLTQCFKTADGFQDTAAKKQIVEACAAKGVDSQASTSTVPQERR